MTRPCDCGSMHETLTKLNEQGLKRGQCGIELKPLSVYLTVGPARVKIPQSYFKMFAEWYLEDQIRED